MEASVSRKWKTIDMAYIALFAVLMAVCSWISIPAVVPFTLQTFGVFVAVSVLGGKRGTLAVVLYLLMGIVGLPVFAGFSGGLGVLLGSTGGYIVGFVFTALTMWLMERLLGTKTWALALSMLLGLVVCYAFGTAWFLVVYTKNTGAIGLWTALGWCVFPYILPDCVKIALALAIRKRLAAAVGCVPQPLCCVFPSSAPPCCSNSTAALMWRWVRCWHWRWTVPLPPSSAASCRRCGEHKTLFFGSVGRFEMPSALLWA